MTVYFALCPSYIGKYRERNSRNSASYTGSSRGSKLARFALEMLLAPISFSRPDQSATPEIFIFAKQPVITFDPFVSDEPNARPGV